MNINNYFDRVVEKEVAPRPKEFKAAVLVYKANEKTQVECVDGKVTRIKKWK